MSDPHWNATTVAEMRSFVGLNIVMGFNSRTSQSAATTDTGRTIPFSTTSLSLTSCRGEDTRSWWSISTAHCLLRGDRERHADEGATTHHAMHGELQSLL